MSRIVGERRWSALIAAALTAGALSVGACSQAAPSVTVEVTPPAQTPEVTATPDATAEPAPTSAPGAVDAIPAGFEQWYSQTINWGGCDGQRREYECATITAPLDWADPTAGSIDLALMRHGATGDKIGSLLINPGGPGQSGVDFLPAVWSAFGVPVQRAFDIIGFDPRGVGGSTQVICMDDAGKDAFISADFPDTDEGREAMAAANAEWGQACYENTGPLLAHVDTMSAARDMDLIRHLVGDERLNYLGFSYGTQLGATYAGLFPQNVGRMVLDGAIDTTLTSDELSLGQAVGFENALRNFVTECQTRNFADQGGVPTGGSCPLTGTVDEGMAQIAALLDGLQTNPLPTQSGRSVNRTLGFYGIATPLYDESSWAFLSMALDEAINRGTGDILLLLADFYNDRNEDGTFASNSTEAFSAIGCVDDRGSSDPAEMAALADQLLAAAPTMGTYFTYGGLGCRDWPVPVAPGSFDLHASGAPPILVIGTTNDPATPYEWAVGLADTLDSGVLLTYDGEGHTAYTRSNQCIEDAVDQFLVDDVVPPNGKRC